MAENVFLDTYYAKGNRENLINLITNISPSETVLLSRLGRTNATGTKTEWMTETLQASNSANAEIEGSTAAYASTDVTPRVRLYNYTQILRKPFSVSKTQLSVDSAGVTDEFAHQRELKTKEMAKDMNAALINQSSASGTSAVARTMNGILTAISSNTAAAGGTPVEQSDFNALMQTIWTAGGRPNAAFCHGFNKRTISSWSQPAGYRTIDATGKKLVVSVDTYDSDFGKIMIYLEREMPTDTIAILEEKYWKPAWLRPLEFEETAFLGGRRSGYVESEMSLHYYAENSSGKITGTATA